MRALRSCCTDVVQEHDLRADPAQCNAERMLSARFALHSSHFTLHTSHLHFTLHTSSHLKACELFSPHLSSSHLIPSPLTCNLRKFFSTVFISFETLINLSHLLEVVLNSSQEGPPESQIFYTYQIFQLLPLVLFLLI